jgi:hypothetical protein
VGVSVTEPLGLAINRTGRMLFKPFQAGKWFTLGFCAWLAHLGEGGGSNINLPGGGPGPMPNNPEELRQWFLRNAYWIVPLVLGVVGLFVLVVWIRARGKFLFLEAVAQDRPAVVEPWKRLRPLGNSFFFFDLLLYVSTFLAMALLVVGALTLAYPDIQARRFGPGAWAALLGGLALLLAGSLVFLLARAVADDFLVPLMYLRGRGIGVAWGEFRRAIVPGNLGAIVLFYLMQVVLGIAVASAVMFITCLTCLLTALPYIGTVLLLPLIVFLRCYSLYFLAQFGNEYNLLVEAEPVRAFQVIMPAAPAVPPPLPPLPPDAGGNVR